MAEVKMLENKIQNYPQRIEYHQERIRELRFQELVENSHLMQDVIAGRNSYRRTAESFREVLQPRLKARIRMLFRNPEYDEELYNQLYKDVLDLSRKEHFGLQKYVGDQIDEPGMGKSPRVRAKRTRIALTAGVPFFAAIYPLGKLDPGLGAVSFVPGLVFYIFGLYSLTSKDPYNFYESLVSRAEQVDERLRKKYQK